MSASAIRNILADRIYLYDRGYSSFSLLRAHYQPTPDREEVLEVKSHFVVRYKKAGGNSPTLSDAVDRRLTDEDRAAGVISDRVGYFASESAQREGIAKIPLREVIIPYEENGEPKTLRLITNLLDISAKTIALLYQHRWQVETSHAHCEQRYTFSPKDNSPYIGNPSVIESGALAPAMPA